MDLNRRAMIQNFRLQKPNLWVDFLDLIGYDYQRIKFDKKGEHYIISSYGKVTVVTQTGVVGITHIDQLPTKLKTAINNEIEKMY